MYIRFMQGDREVLPLGRFEQRPATGDVLVVEDRAYSILDQPGRFEKRTIIEGTVVWGLTLQVSPLG